MQMIDINTLSSHPRNNEFFDDIQGDNWSEFKKSIETSGVIESIVITQNKVIVSGHQRVRACKEIGLKEIPCEIKIYEDEDKIIKDLLETNLRQRGIGNTNPIKFGRCIVELEKIYGIRQGSAFKKADGDNAPQLTQSDLAGTLGIGEKQLRDYKKLLTLIPELQDLVEDGDVSSTVGYKVLSRLSKEQQEQLVSEFGKEYISKLTQKNTQELIQLNKNIQESEQSKKKLENDLLFLKKQKPKEIDKPETLQKIKLLEENKIKINQEKEDYVNRYKKTLIDLKEEQLKVSKFMGDSTNFELVSSTSELTLKMINFIKEMSKYDYLSEVFNEIPDSTRKEYVRSIYGVYKWSVSILNEVKVDDVLGVNKNYIKNIKYTEVNN